MGAVVRTPAVSTLLRRPISVAAVVVRTTLLLAWMAAIYLFSTQPGEVSDVPSDALAGYVESLGVGLPIEFVTFAVRKSAHAFAFFGLGILAFLVLRLSTLSTRGVAVACLGFVILFAISDEVHQLFVPGRSGEIRDVLIDVAAGAAGMLVMLLIHRAAKGGRLVRENKG